MRLTLIALLIAVGATPAASHEFRDCRACPDMVVIPAGHFTMGARVAEPGATSAESPAHQVQIPTPFAIGKFDVTRSQFAAFAGATGYRINSPKCDWRTPRAHGEPMKQSAADPVVCVSWTDAAAYTGWLRKMTGKPYRLPSEAEWEYATRAGSIAIRPWGDTLGRDNANYGADRCCGPFAAGKDRWLYTSPVGSFAPNAFGLYDMLGNVWQWVQECGHATYAGAPTNGSGWPGGDCSTHMVRGGAWFQAPDSIRSAARAADRADFRIGDIGFRVARSL